MNRFIKLGSINNIFESSRNGLGHECTDYYVNAGIAAPSEFAIRFSPTLNIVQMHEDFEDAMNAASLVWRTPHISAKDSIVLTNNLPDTIFLPRGLEVAESHPERIVALGAELVRISKQLSPPRPGTDILFVDLSQTAIDLRDRQPA
jgi:hypothetical protein